MTLGRIKNFLFTTLIGLMGVLIALPVAAQDPFSRPDDTWITIDGEVESVTRNAFNLDYGESSIIVEFDDAKRDTDAYRLLPGDKVSVFGKIDDDFFEGTTIEARSVYIEKLGTNFYATVDDNDPTERVLTYGAITPPVVVSSTVLQGVVTQVGSDDFTLSTDNRAINVEVGTMSYNPLDDEGYQKIDVGDHVWVSGKIDKNLFEGRELHAESIVILHDTESAM